MSTWKQPKLKDIQKIYRLIGECTELGSDSAEWRLHMLDALREITGARIGLYTQMQYPMQAEERLAYSMASRSMEDFQLAIWEQYQRDKAHRDDPHHHNFFQSFRGRLQTRELHSVVKRREWELSRHYNDFIRPCGLNDRITTSLRLSNGPDVSTQTIVLLRDASDGRFPETTKYLIHLFHHELAGLLDKRLSLPDREDAAERLPPRLEQVLDGLLKGESEKQIARQLDISHHTVNRHVQRLYRHFNVNSRTKLMGLLLPH